MTAPVEEAVERTQYGTGLSHAWCLRCLRPAPAVAVAFCGFRTAERLSGPSPKLPMCVVCAELWPLGCERCGS